MRNSLFSFGLLVAQLIPSALGTFPKPPVIFPVRLTYEKRAPDGFEREIILTNGQFPGPLLELEQGDNVEFIVHNDLPFATTMHFHGIEQIGTPWSDGVPGVTQKVIESGATFVYRWTAVQYGTYWYHAHEKGQLEDGMFGPIYIKPTRDEPAPWGLISKDPKTRADIEYAGRHPQVVTLSDWSHYTSTELHKISLDANVDVLCGDSLLINGKGKVNCPGVPFLMSLVPPPVLPLLVGQNLTDKGCIDLKNPIAQTNGPHNFDLVPPGVWYGCKASDGGTSTISVPPSRGWASLNFISTASLQEMVVSIDEHPMWVYEIDGRYIEPQLVDAMTLSHGSRHSVLIQLNKPAKDYTLRVASSGLNQKAIATGLISYAHGSHKVDPKPSINYGGAGTSTDVRFLNDMSVVPYPPVHPAKKADKTFKLLLNRTETAWQWTLNNNTPFKESFNDMTPLLWQPREIPSLTISTKYGQWVDLIFLVTNTGGLQPPHPIHRHGTKAHLIGAGQGDFTWTDVAEAIKAVPGSFNLDNPPYRDGFYTLPVLSDPTWMVIRYHVTNPGPFFLHCHINPHLTGGMALAILDGVDKWPKVPKEYGPGGNGYGGY